MTWNLFNTIFTDEECGVVAVQATPFITHGQQTIHGQYPWHAALYHNKNVDLTYICGANLISKNYVLTVAHCATRQSTGQPVNANLLVVVLGKYLLDRLATVGIQERMVRNYDLFSKLVQHLLLQYSL